MPRGHGRQVSTLESSKLYVPAGHSTEIETFLRQIIQVNFEIILCDLNVQIKNFGNIAQPIDLI